MNLLLSSITDKGLQITLGEVSYFVTGLWCKCLESQTQTTWKDEMAGKGKKMPSKKWIVRWRSPSAQLNSPYKVTRRTQSPTCPLPQDAYPGNPFPSSSLSGKSMNTEGHLQRQVRISLTKLHITQLTRRWQSCLCANATHVAQPV